MIILQINGITLPMPPDQKITRDFETTLLNRDTDVSDITFPFDIPLTDEAMVALGFPTHLANTAIQKSYDAQLSVDGIHFWHVKVQVLKISLRDKLCSVSIIGDYGTAAAYYGSKKVNELNLGGKRTIGTSSVGIPTETPLTAGIYVKFYPCDSHIHIGNTVAGTLVTDYVFGKAIDYECTNTPQFQDNCISIINGWDRMNGRIVEAVRYNILASFPQDGGYWAGLSNPERHYWVPFFRLAFVLRCCFEECRLSVSGAILSDAAFNNIVLYNTFSINRCSILKERLAGSDLKLHVVDKSTTINPQDHVPRMPIYEFINEIAKNYNLQYVYNHFLKTVTVRKLNDLATASSVKDLTAIALPDPDITFEEDTGSIKGFEFSFETDSADAASGQDVQDDATTRTLRGGFATPAAIVVASPLENEVVFIASENAYYTYDGVEWVFYSHNLASYKTADEDGLQSIKTKCITMPMAIEPMHLLNMGSTSIPPTGSLITINGEVTPFSSIGIEGRQQYTFDYSKRIWIWGAPVYDEWVDVFSAKDYLHGKQYLPHLLCWLGFQSSRTDPATVGVYPYAGYNQVSATPYNAKGIWQGGYGQSWYIPASGSVPVHGLHPDWWAKFTAQVSNRVVIEQQLLMDVVTYNNLDLQNDIIYINQLRYICLKGQVVMPFPEISTLTLIKI